MKGLLEGKPKTKAAREAGYSNSTADHATAEIARTRGVQELLDGAMSKAGITDELLAQRMREGLDAMETKVFQRRGYVQVDTESGSGEGAVSLPADELITKDLIAFSERRAMVDLILDVTGKKAARKLDLRDRTLEDILSGTYDNDAA